ncbi:chemotaxis protein CheB [Blastochloris tepida]|uniref:Sensor histidine kinase n=1 Tax=Blastochloris tepida TaxID=2233851 RepID=A0A348FXB6_9HYPH|nr:chemotaxis protein CheB [Blastochloris tepida]BBF91949.1 sensor histidine kinase [Blastochloris tepida]
MTDQPGQEVSTDDAPPKVVPPEQDDLRVVGIGASAGGLEALRPLIAALPESSNLCFVIIQHLSPQHRSMMVDLLARETRIPVRSITNRTALKPNVIYVTPPNCDVLYRSGKLILRAPLDEKGPKPSIDQFFASLAAELAGRAIGVVLSGTGSDGANGIRAIKAHGGITFAQDPVTAKYESMPRAAIMTGGADIVLPPKEIAAKLGLTAKGQDLHLEMTERASGVSPFHALIQVVRRHTGMDFSNYKETTLRRRIGRRMATLKIKNLKDYVSHIDTHREEIDVLAKSFMISVTSFMRDTEAFAALEPVLEKLAAKKQTGETLRIWVPACATGEEAYSIALLLAKKTLVRHDAPRVQIFGTDIDTLATMQARRGEFTSASVAHLDRALLRNHFVKAGNVHRISKFVRDMVVFSRHDVVNDPPFKNIDLISCRNLLIYFKPALQERILKLFHYAMAPGGYLFLGRSESLGSSRSLFSAVDLRHKIYHRRDVSNRPHHIARLKEPYTPPDQGAKKPGKAPGLSSQTLVQAGINLLADSYGPPSILLSRDGDPLHFYGNVSRFIRVGAGTGPVDFNLMTLVDPAFRSDLRVLLHRCTRDRLPIRGQYRESHPAGRLVRLAMHPVDNSEADDPLFMLSFEEAEQARPRGKKAAGLVNEVDIQQVATLEQELKATKENLQSVVEELETSNEELQAANEELHASNEELQASNEELETTNEELQATNEELSTVNDELSAKTNALAEINGELEGILANSVEAIVLIDPKLQVLRYNSKAARILRLSPMPDKQNLLKSGIIADMPQILTWIDAVLTTGRNHVGEIQIDQGTFLMQISANKVRKRLRGAIITVSDMTELRRAQQAAAEHGRRAEHLIKTSSEGIIITDRTGRVVVCNPAACAFLDVAADNVIGFPADRLFFDSDRAEALLEHLLSTSGPNAERRLEISIPRNDQFRHFDVLLSEFAIESGCYRAITLRDNTRIREMSVTLEAAKKLAEEASRAKTDFLAKMSHELRTPLNAIVGFSDAILSEVFGHLQHERYLSYITDIHTSGIHLANLINDIFDIAKIEAGMLQLREATVDLVELVSNTVNVVSPVAAKAGVMVVPDIRAAQLFMTIDERRIRQVLLNVLSNAIKFSPRGSTVRVKVLVPEGGGAAIEVQDSGIGMTQETVARIGSGPITSGLMSPGGEEGTGLGLPVSIALMQAHGGTLSIDSTPGRGTAVTLIFGPDRVLLRPAPNGGNDPRHHAHDESAIARFGQGHESPGPFGAS